MKGFNAGALLAVGVLLQCAIEAMSFGILRAFLSPPMPRVKRIKNSSPRAIRAQDPFAVSDFTGLVTQYNYPAEEHNVTTADGYILILHRIPSSPDSRPEKRKPVVLIQHGILASSDTWVLMGPGKDIAFLLADAGYDVWLGNFRGNSYSRFHRVINPENPAFWQFSYHEMGYYDLPAMIDYILEQTGQKNLTYVGHSMGSTTSYVLLSTRPEYNKRLRLVVNLAPIAYWRHKFQGLNKLVLKNGDLIQGTLRSEGIYELIPQSRLYTELIAALCSDGSVTQAICMNAIFSVQGFDYQQFNSSLVPYISGYYPAGASRKNIEHYFQNVVTGEFRQYDYGYIENFQRYQQEVPPDYDFTKVTAPVALFYGKNDFLSAKEGVVELQKRLPNIVTTVEIAYKFFNHLDFLWAIDAKRLLYDDVIDVIRKF